MARKRKSKPTSQKRGKRQSTKERYARAREDAQLEGLIPTTPEGALRPEAVPPSAQGMFWDGLPALVREAIKESWATPDAAKPAIVAALLEAFYKEEEVVDAEGNVVRVRASKKMLIELARTLMQLDQRQWERDNPDKSGRAKGGGNKVGVLVNNGTVQTGDVFADIERDIRIIEGQQVDAAPDSDISQDGVTEPLDAT